MPRNIQSPVASETTLTLAELHDRLGEPGHIVEVFEAAHDLDPTIPRLVPIATRRLLKPRHRQAKGPGPAGDLGGAQGAPVNQGVTAGEGAPA